MPTRPSQTDPDQRARWEHIRLEVGARIRARRLQQGLTQEALALEAGMSRNTLIGVEHGRIGVLYERLYDLAEVLDLNVSELLSTRVGLQPPETA